MRMKKIILLVSIACSTVLGVAQQDAMYTHYMFNTLAVNPGYAGSRDALTVTALHRSQWVGFDGAPTTQTLTIHSPVSSDKFGFGLSSVNDQIGPINTFSAYADFAYRIALGNQGSKLAFGFKGGLSMLSANLRALETETAGDQAFNNNIESQLLPNFGFGLYYSNSNWYVGLSIPRLLENNYENNVVTGGTSLASEKRHYYMIAGYAWELSETISLKPTTLVKMTNGAPLEVDLTAQVVFKNRFWVAPTWRSMESAGALVGFQFTDQLTAGYSFDWSFTNRTFVYNQGSHEIMLRYDFFFRDQKKILSPRYF